MGTGNEDEPSPSTKNSPHQETSMVSNDSELSSPNTERLRSESIEDSLSDDSMEQISLVEPTPGPDPMLVENFDEHLPETVTLLTMPNGAKVYLVGTAHFSVQSQDDVSKVIRNVRPHIVMVELCRNRASILQMDEATIEREAKSITLEKMMATIRENGLFNGLMYTLFLNLSAQLTRDLGMAPGGEFRRALKEVRSLPCVIHFGDRPIQVTLKRALSVLSLVQKAKLVWYLIAPASISKEEIEKCKQKDLLEQMLQEMSGKFPELGRVFVEERDTYLTYSLQLAAHHQPRRAPAHPVEPVRVVGIVGIGHMAGITRLWGTVRDRDIPPIMTVPPPGKTGSIIRSSLKVAVAGLLIYGIYKMTPASVSESVGKLSRNAVSLVKWPSQ